MKTSEGKIVIETNINCRVDLLWKCITDIELLKDWFFENIPDFKAVMGFKVSFPVKSNQRIFTHKWEIAEVNKPNKLSLKWSYIEHEGDSIVNFIILENKDNAVFKVEVDVLKDFDDNIPEFKRESCIGGWEYFSQRLKVFAESLKQ